MILFAGGGFRTRWRLWHTESLPAAGQFPDTDELVPCHRGSATGCRLPM
jgi:hypothetical protein